MPESVDLAVDVHSCGRRRPVLCRWPLFIAASFLCTHQPAGAGSLASASEATLLEAIREHRTLQRADYLRLLLEPSTAPASVLIEGLGSSDEFVRALVVVRLGELQPEAYVPQVLAALFKAVDDRNPDVSARAVASILRVGVIAPEALLPFLEDLQLLRRFEYWSKSANSERAVDLTASDLALTGLMQGPGTAVDELVNAFIRAKAKEEGKKERDARDEQRSASPGDSRYYAQALEAVLTRTADANRALIGKLLDSEHDELRKLAYYAAARVSSERSGQAAKLASAVRTGRSKSDRENAARALATMGDTAKTILAELAGSEDDAVRALVLPLLLVGARCDGPAIPLLLAERDPEVRSAAFLEVLQSPERHDLLPCLAPSLADVKFNLPSRLRLLDALLYDREDSRWNEAVHVEIGSLVEEMRAPLLNRDAELHGMAWRSLPKILDNYPDASSQVARIASELMQTGKAGGDAGVPCVLAALDTNALAADPALVMLMLRDLAEDEYIDGCLLNALSRLDFRAPQKARQADALIWAIEKRPRFSASEAALVEKSVPPELFAVRWRQMAKHFTGNGRLLVLRIAASRGMGVDEAISLFSAVLSGDNSGLGRYEGDDDAHSAPRTDFMGTSIDGLMDAGDRGAEVVRGILRGQRGTAYAREVALDVLTRPGDLPTRQMRVRQLALALLAAVGDKDPGVRSSAVAALSLATDGQELIDIIRPLFRDRSKEVLYAVVELIEREKPGGIAPYLTPKDAENIVNGLSTNKDEFARASAADLMVTLRGQLPPSFMERGFARLLADPSSHARESALNNLGALGSVAAPILVDALRHGNQDLTTSRNLIPALAAVKSPSDRADLLALILDLQRQRPESGLLLRAVSELSGDQPEWIDFFAENLLSDSAAARAAALADLTTRGGFFSTPSDRYLAALLDARLGAEVDARTAQAIEEIRPYVGPIPVSGRVDSFPQFPWPPPTWSFKEVIPRELIAGDGDNLGDLSRRIIDALRASSDDFDFGIFEIPDGFAILARLEHIRADGTPYQGRDRWITSPIPARSLEDYLVQLFFSPPGYFRVIAFAVADSEPLESDPTSSLPRFGEGARALPDRIAKLAAADKEAFALIYTFQRFAGGKMISNYQGSPSGLTHLRASGIWSGLQGAMARRSQRVK